MQVSINRRTKNIIFFLSIVIVFSFTGFIAVNTAVMITDNIYDGVFVGNIPLGGLSIDEAKKKIIITFKHQTDNSPISLTYKTQRWSINNKDIDLNIDADNLARQAYI
jgi:hypothetical protein